MQKQLVQTERELKIRNYSSKTVKSYLYRLEKTLRKSNLHLESSEGCHVNQM